MIRSLCVPLLLLPLAACGDDGGGSSGTTGNPPGSTSDAPTTMTAAGSSTGDGSSGGSSSEGGSSSGSAGTGTTAADDTTGAASTGSDGSGSGSGSGESSTGAAACTPIAFTAVDEPAFSGNGFCEGVQQNAVLADAQAVGDHHDAWCASVAACMFPEPPCPSAPALPAEGEQIVYVFGTDSGCAGFATIDEVLDCGDTIEVHYLVGGNGGCATIVHAWAAVAIPAGDAEVVFVPR